jgi:hypothetical protein
MVEEADAARWNGPLFVITKRGLGCRACDCAADHPARHRRIVAIDAQLLRGAKL